MAKKKNVKKNKNLNKDMKNTQEKKMRKFHIPSLTPLALIIIVLAIVLIPLIISIPIVYVSEYNKMKVTPFESDLKEIEKSNIFYGNKNTIDDFNFVLFCSNYNNTTGEVQFQTFAYENEKTRSVMKADSEVSVKLGMYSDWIKFEQTSSSYTRYVASGPKVALGTSSRYRAEFTIRNVPTLPKKGNLWFIDIDSIPVYAHVTYSTTINGTETKKHYVLKYEAKDYIIGAKTIEETREKEYQIANNNIQWRYKRDTSWATLTSTSDFIGIQARYADGFIQWKRYTDETWSNLETRTVTGDITKLSGYKEGLTPVVKIENGYIYYRFSDSGNWVNLINTSILQGIDVDVKDGYIVWRRWNQTEFQNLKAVTELPEYTSDKVVEVRTSGGSIQWRYKEGNYTNLQTIDSLMGMEIKVNDSKLQWKCRDESIWKDVTINGNPVLESTIDSTPAKYGPTGGDFKK
ncbi:hypothetical protein HDR67_01320 [bacterium]|nr:hypothetical protein [bacterium]